MGSENSPSGTAAVILGTTDGGLSWAVQTVPPGTAGLGGVSCPSDSHCVAVGSSGVLVGRPGGSWTPVNVPRVSYLVDVACPSASDCVAVGDGYGGGQLVLGTSDSGSTWMPEPAPTNEGPPRHVSCTSVSDCQIVTYHRGEEVILRTADSGRSWTPGTLPAGPGFNAIACETAADCFGVGTGVVDISTDGGHSWATETSPVANNDELTSIACPSDNECIAVGYATSPAQGAILLRYAGN